MCLQLLVADFSVCVCVRVLLRSRLHGPRQARPGPPVAQAPLTWQVYRQ